jgi:hypothetical protein
VERIVCIVLGCGRAVASGSIVHRKRRIGLRGGRGERHRRGCCGGDGGVGGCDGVAGVVIEWRHAWTRKGGLVGF